MAHETVIETKMDIDEVANGETAAFHVELSYLKGIDPLRIEFDTNSSIEEMTTALAQQLKLNHSLQLQTTMPFDSIPPTFAVTVGAQDQFNFDAGHFTISKTTRFVEYWNEFLDAANQVDEEKDNDQTEGEVQFDGTLKAKLNGTTLTIGDARIQFQRTLRIPDDGKTYPLPPSLGHFAVVKVQDHEDSDGIPSSWSKRKGCIIPMWQKEAMWMDFSANSPC